MRSEGCAANSCFQAVKSVPPPAAAPLPTPPHVPPLAAPPLAAAAAPRDCSLPSPGPGPHGQGVWPSGPPRRVMRTSSALTLKSRLMVRVGLGSGLHGVAGQASGLVLTLKRLGAEFFCSAPPPPATPPHARPRAHAHKQHHHRPNSPLAPRVRGRAQEGGHRLVE